MTREWGTDKPLAVKGLISYRYRGIFGWVMIGAHGDVDALRQAERSIGDRATRDKLEIWQGDKYVKVQP